MPEPESHDGPPIASENPYQSPIAYGGHAQAVAAQVFPSDPEHLRRVAIYQKCVLVAVAIYLSNAILIQTSQLIAGPLPTMFVLVLSVVGIVAALSGIVSVGLLAGKMYGVVVGVVMAMLAFLPCINLIMLFIINHQATKLLKRNNIHVGLLGARMNDLPAREII